MQMMFMTKKHLTLQAFLSELNLIAEYFQWEKPGQRQSRETCYVRGYKSGMLFCPITAVAYVLKGVNFSQNKWGQAAKTINLPQDIGMQVIGSC